MQNEESFSEGDSLNVTTAKLAAMGADNVTSRRGRLSSDDRRMTQVLAEKQEGMEETLSQLDERVSEQESQLVESRLEILAVREKMDEYMQLTAELGEEVSKLKVELTYAKDMDEELSEPPDRVVPAHTNGSNSTREKHSRRQSTGTNAPDTFFTSCLLYTSPSPRD